MIKEKDRRVIKESLSPEMFDLFFNTVKKELTGNKGRFVTNVKRVKNMLFERMNKEGYICIKQEVEEESYLNYYAKQPDFPSGYKSM
jgi:hypothetical protein